MTQKGKIINVLYLVVTVLITSCSQTPSELFVSPDGSDLYPGTESKPFRNLEMAKKVVRLQLKENPGKAVVVTIKGGGYYLKGPIVFTEEDSGTEKSPVVYKAADGEEPVFTGGMKLNKWHALENVAKLRMLPPGIQDRIYVTDLVVEGITDFGDATDIGKRPELFCNGQAQTLARWPNEGFVKAGIAKGKTELPPRYIKKHGTKEGVFEYLGERQDKWAAENDVRLGGYWYWDWSDEFQKVNKVDVASHTLILSEPYHRYGYGDSLRYFGINMFCEIDQPGEWYLDRQAGLLYWLPPKGVDPKKEDVVLSVFNAPYMVETRGCSNIKFQGLAFQEGRENAILVSDGGNCLFADCRIERFGNDGVHIDGGLSHGISGCYLSSLGCGGICVKGGDRKTLSPANHFIENTVVKDFSLFKRTYEPAVHAEGCGISIRHNCFQNSSSSAMRLEGNDITVEYNEVDHVVNESDDQGGVDMWYNPSYRGIVIRYNYWHDIKGGTVHGAAGVRLDDMISGVEISGNVFARCGALHFGGVQIHGGKDNLVENNLFYDCLAAVSFSSWGEKRWQETLAKPEIQKRIYKDVDIRSDVYLKKYPELKNINKNADVNTVRDNLVVDCGQVLLKDRGQNINENNTEVNSEGKPVEEFCKEEVLKKYGLLPIPFSKIGVQNNKWIK